MTPRIRGALSTFVIAALLVLGVGNVAPAMATQALQSQTQTAASTSTTTPPKATSKDKLLPVKARWNTPRKALPEKSGGVSTLSTCVSACYFYAGGRQFFTAPGVTKPNTVSSNVRFKKPFLQSMDYHSLGETAIIQGSGATRQIVEAGWTVDRVVNGGSSEPFFFVGAWKNGSFLGYNSQFTVYDANCIQPGQQVTNGNVGKITIQNANGSWWVQIDTNTADGVAACWPGYFSSTIWTNTPSVTFNTFEEASLFGEVAANDDHPCTKMGNGEQGNPGSLTSAYFGSYSVNSGTGIPAPSLSYFTDPVRSPAPYTVAGSSGSVRTFTYGGTGYSSVGGTTISTSTTACV